MANQSNTVLRGCLLLFVCLATPGFSGVGISTTRSVPTEYSKPVYVKGKDGKVTYIPPIPTSFEKRTVGVGGQIGRSASGQKEKRALPRLGVLIRIEGEPEPTLVYQGDVFTAGGESYRMLNIWDDGIEYQRLATGEIFRKARPRKVKEGDGNE